MKKIEIYWRDLSIAKRAELIPDFCPYGEPPVIPIAIGWAEDAHITPENYPGNMTEIELFYRDGANYKYTEVFRVPTERLKEAKDKAGEAFYDQDEAQIQYDYDLGISRQQFHDTIGSAYDDEYDHNFVIITKIDGVPNEPK